MIEHSNTSALCPHCGKTYTGHPALSRLDNKTQICPDCGVLEALASLDIKESEQKEILEIIHKYSSEIKS